MSINSSQKRKILHLGLLILLQFALVGTGAAQSLVIADCQGFTRAIQSVNPGELSNVEVSVVDPSGGMANGMEVTLTNATTGEVTTAVANNGVAVFENVASGTFTISSPASGAVVGGVGVSSAGVGTVAATGVVGTTAATGGGGAVVAGREVVNQVDDVTGGTTEKSSDSSDSSDGKDPNSPFGGGPNDPLNIPNSEEIDENTPPLEETPQAETPTPTPPSTSTPPPTEVEECPDCEPDATPPSLDDETFFEENPPIEEETVFSSTPLSPSQ